MQPLYYNFFTHQRGLLFIFARFLHDVSSIICLISPSHDSRLLIRGLKELRSIFKIILH
jgi:hypothetical protein